MTGRGRPCRYPWGKWFSRDKATFIEGKHFSCTPSSFMQSLRRMAKLRGIAVSVSVKSNAVMMKVLARYAP